MKNLKLPLLILISLTLFQSCREDLGTEEQVYPIVEISTSFGNMYIHLYDSTPLHKSNFLKLVNDGFYDSTEFHRIIPNFVIQGGDPLSKDEDRGNDGTGGTGYTIPAEIDSSIFKHIYGALGAARKGNDKNPERESSGSQFYIVTNPFGTPHLDGEYTVFGEVVGGMDVAKKIQSQPRNLKDLPHSRIPMIVNTLYLNESELELRNIVSPKQ